MKTLIPFFALIAFSELCFSQYQTLNENDLKNKRLEVKSQIAELSEQLSKLEEKLLNIENEISARNENKGIYLGMLIGDLRKIKRIQDWDSFESNKVIYNLFVDDILNPSIYYCFSNDTLNYYTNDVSKFNTRVSFIKGELAKQNYNRWVSNYGKGAADKLLNKTIWIGMTSEMFLEIMSEPNDINKTVGSFGTHEQWVYGKEYYYFENGKLTSWQY